MRERDRWRELRRGLSLCLGVLALVGGCGDDVTSVDSGTDAGVDGGRDGSTADAASDAAVDGSFDAEIDAGPDAGPEGGWTDPLPWLVASDGTHSLGELATPNTTRDSGSKILFFDEESGDNESGEVYWWDGERIVDSSGSPTNEAGEAYGEDPRTPNLAAIRPFQRLLGILRNSAGDLRLRTNHRGRSALAGGFPDWVLFRRAQTHRYFDDTLSGGRSPSEPLVVSAYGPVTEARPLIAPAEGETVSFTLEGETLEHEVVNPLLTGTGGDEEVWHHIVLLDLDLRARLSSLGTHDGSAISYSGGAPTLMIEGCRFIPGEGDTGGRLSYLPQESTIRRSSVAFCYHPDAHNQGFFTGGYVAATQFEEVFFYRNGFKDDPRVHADPGRDIFSRNAYQGGGAQNGHRYDGVVFADGASGGPQVRLGGTVERSLIVEGYWYLSTASNSNTNPWLVEGPQAGSSGSVVDNVQLVYEYPSVADPDPEDLSDSRAQPGWGLGIQGASFGVNVERNIISGAMSRDELGAVPLGSIAFIFDPAEYQDGQIYTQQRNTLRENIVYGTRWGLRVETDDWSGTDGLVVANNVFAAEEALLEVDSTNLSSAEQFSVTGNRFYGEASDPGAPWYGVNTIGDDSSAEGWPDPDRTLRRYVVEVLGLTILDWDDDPWLDATEAATRRDAGEAYDPTGLRTFMAVALNMRRGGAEAPPSSGKPDWLGEYAWDARFTAPAVVSWIREGFGMSALE